ncbi:response regulator [Muricauda sp. SCSIO 64092]|uniref:response regulator transcription factor n=1 Tax=Allomuricauda sp. SCSIO 64092 TaxID=2908842 RepID=UPI001FF28959|nr:response regulator [Muricauda sp. SCSIO 64092]UOY07004.1 response regulator [Muricauda sp. SCSIO 64092]
MQQRVHNGFNILIVEDHPFVCEGYKKVLEPIVIEYAKKHIFHFAYDCEEALECISNSIRGSLLYDLVILDYRLPIYEEKGVLSGEDIGLKIRKESSNTKIIVITSISCNYTLNGILQTLHPNGLAYKGDLDGKTLTEGFKTILQDKVFYSERIVQMLSRHLELANRPLDQIDRKILYLLSKGFRTNELPKLVYLSMSGIEKRKRNLFSFFGITTGQLSDLIQAGTDGGYL